MMMFEISHSARRHGIADDDILHAVRNAIRALHMDDKSMLIGADRSGRLLEVGVLDDTEVCRIIHAMPARAKHLR